MMQLFELFDERYLQQLLKMERHYLVTQTYIRAVNTIEDGGRIPILLTDYDDHGAALIHYNAVRKLDTYGYVLDLSKPAHLLKLCEMMAGEKYRLYWAVVNSLDDLKKRIERRYKPNIRRFIEKKTSWRIAGDDSVKTTLQMVFGEIFMTIHWRSREIRVKFEEIEKT